MNGLAASFQDSIEMMRARPPVKLRALDEEDVPVDARDAREETVYYDVKRRRMHRCSFHNPVDEPYFFRYSKKPGSRILVSPGMTPTHEILQDLIFDLNFVRCRLLDGRDFYAYLGNSEIEHRTKPDDNSNKKARRYDNWCDCVTACIDERFVGGPLAVEIGVSSLVRADRQTDLCKDGIPTLELLPERQRNLEGNTEELRRFLKDQLLDGKIRGRWVYHIDHGEQFLMLADAGPLILAELGKVETRLAIARERHAAALAEHRRLKPAETADHIRKVTGLQRNVNRCEDHLRSIANRQVRKG